MKRCGTLQQPTLKCLKYHVYASRANKHADIIRYRYRNSVFYSYSILLYSIMFCSVLFCSAMPCHQISFNVVHIHISYYDRMMSVYLHRGFSAGSCRVLPGPSSDRGGVPAEVATGTPGRQQLMVCFCRGW